MHAGTRNYWRQIVYGCRETQHTFVCTEMQYAAGHGERGFD